MPFSLKHAPIRQGFPLFVLAAAFNLAAIRQLGLVEDGTDRLVRASIERDVPRPERHRRYDWVIATEASESASAASPEVGP